METSGKNSIFYVVHGLGRQLRRRFENATQSQGLTMSQWRALGQLAQRDGVSQAALATMIESDPMTVSGMMERLEAKGLVIRTADPTDSRANIVSITPKARGMVQDMKALVHSAHAHAFEGISEADQKTALSVLVRVSENLAAHEAVDEELIP